MRVFVDIESLPGHEKPTVKEMKEKAPKNMTKEATIQKWAEENAELEYRKQSLNSMKGQILCIGFTVDDEKPQIIYDKGPNEENVLINFDSFLYNTFSLTWIGHNIKQFDLLWLYRKAIKYNLQNLANLIPTQKYSHMVEDTAELWSGPAWKDYCKLDDIAKFLGIPGKNGIDGSMVYDLWLVGEHEKIKQYCLDDVRLVRNVYKRINFMED